MTTGLNSTGVPAVSSEEVVDGIRQRAGSAPHSMLTLSRTLSLHARTRQFVIERLPEPWQGILLDFLDLLCQKSSEFFDGDTVDSTAENFGQLPLVSSKKLRSVAAAILLACLLGFFYILLSESILQFLLPFYAAISAFYWFIYWWRRKHLTPYNENQVDVLLSVGFGCEILITVVCRWFKSVIPKYAIGALSPILCFWGAKILCFDDSLVRTLTPPFIVVYLVRIFAKQSFTLFPAILRPFLGYSACFLGQMAAKFAPQQKHVVLCDYVNDKSDSTSASSAHHKHLAGGPPISASHRLASLGEVEIQRNFAVAGRSRRTSLPASASSLLKNRAQNNLNEASGLIADMLAKGDLPGHVVSCLKAINRLMSPQPTVDLHLDLGLPKFVENPFSGEQLAVAGQSRAGTVTWSTTTSATGVSNVEAEPTRARSSSFWAKKQDSTEKEPSSYREATEKVAKCVLDGTEFHFRDIESDLFLSCLTDWDFPIFKLNKESPDTVLTKVEYTMFNGADLFQLFKISKSKFVNFFHSLEKGYWDIPYHNRIHAADVTHSCYHLTYHPVSVISSEDEGGFESLASVMSALELMALYTAAAMHDYDHPGVTNAFLVAAGDPKAILYNDRSVLENHHAAASWKLLSKTENYFIDQLDADEYKRFRFLVTELILATDLKHHFDVLMEFNSKTKGGGFDWEQEGDRLLACKLVIKMGDINSPMKPNYLHRQWTERIIEEFYAQGDRERLRDLPVSPYMNRDEPNIAKLQDSFIAHLIYPMAQAMHDAGLLPVDAENPNAESELLRNMKENHKSWLKELGGDEEKSEDGSQNSQDEADGEMGTIGEEEEDECV